MLIWLSSTLWQGILLILSTFFLPECRFTRQSVDIVMKNTLAWLLWIFLHSDLSLTMGLNQFIMTTFILPTGMMQMMLVHLPKTELLCRGLVISCVGRRCDCIMQKSNKSLLNKSPTHQWIGLLNPIRFGPGCHYWTVRNIQGWNSVQHSTFRLAFHYILGLFPWGHCYPE